MGSLTTRLRNTFACAFDKIRNGELRTLVPFLCMFKANGKPMDLKHHYQFAPLFNTVQPNHTVMMCARQVGKSWSVAEDAHLRSGLVPGYHIMIVQPRFDQIQRFNSTVFQPLMRSCPLQDEFITNTELAKVSLKTYRNGSLVYLDSMYLSADRIRGTSGIATSVYDESVFGDEPVVCADFDGSLKFKTKKISEIRKGDICVSFAYGVRQAVLSVAARDASFHGVRRYFRITTMSGRTLTCTADHALPTALGRLRLSEIVDYASSIVTGESEAGQCAPADGLCPVWVPDIVRVRYSTTVDLAESDIQRKLDGIDSGKPWPVWLYVCSCAQAWSATGIESLVFCYERILKVEYVGELPGYDIETVGTHNYILASGICSYNCQDLDLDNINIANEVMSASLFWGFSRYTGTPKTTDTTLALLWNRSSQAEWIIRCTHCGRFNVPNPDHDLLKMIGKEGPICAVCGKPINPANGGYVHAFPERVHSFAGYHIPQTIHPLHANYPNKWARLLEKIDNYEPLVLFNEVYGWPYDAATSPLTLADLMKATHELPEIKTPRDIERIKSRYRYITVGVDWGGGGVISDSYTAYAVLGLRAPSDVVDVLYGRRIPKGMSPMDEVREIMSWIVGVGADAFAFDNGGAGFARLEMMKQEGLMSVEGLTVIPINYVAPRSGDVMRPHTRQRESDLYYYTLDKSRSLAICIQAIKSCRICFPKFSDTDEDAYQRDFLALREDPSKSSRGETVILIAKKPGVPDDFAHAVNFGCSQLWDHFGAYPRIGTRYDTSALELDEDGQRLQEDVVFGPRGDFNRFQDAVDMRAASFQTGDIYGW